MVELKRTELAVARENAIIVGASRGDAEAARESLDELRRLSDTAGAVVVGECIQHRPFIEPATYLGSGKVEELRLQCEALDADVVIMDVDLSAAQVRNLEKATDRKVIDRTELILDIFARGARTSAACDQVELAQLEYLFPRLRRMWTHLERIEGGIGMRGPGERQIETDRRLVRKRITDLKESIARSAARREREVASRSQESTACLVGYTNAGKSTLMNALTSARVLADDKLFSTLDTRTRLCDLGQGRRLLLSDTVGFIRHLPHHLVASFHATLEEARQADLLLHVVDASSPSAERQMEAVGEVLTELDCDKQATVPVYNKMDRVEDESRLPILRKRFGKGAMISAKTGAGLGDLRQSIREALDRQAMTLTVEMPPSAGKLQAFLSGHCEVVSEHYGGDKFRLRVRIAPRHMGLIRKMGGKVMRVKAPQE